MGALEVQVDETPQTADTSLVGAPRAPSARSVRSLEASLWTRPNNGSRMRREPHVRFCERAVVRFRRATHLHISHEHEPATAYRECKLCKLNRPRNSFYARRTIFERKFNRSLPPRG